MSRTEFMLTYLVIHGTSQDRLVDHQVLSSVEYQQFKTLLSYLCWLRSSSLIFSIDSAVISSFTAVFGSLSLVTRNPVFTGLVTLSLNKSTI